MAHWHDDEPCSMSDKECDAVTLLEKYDNAAKAAYEVYWKAMYRDIPVELGVYEAQPEQHKVLWRKLVKAAIDIQRQQHKHRASCHGPAGELQCDADDA